MEMEGGGLSNYPRYRSDQQRSRAIKVSYGTHQHEVGSAIVEEEVDSGRGGRCVRLAGRDVGDEDASLTTQPRNKCLMFVCDMGCLHSREDVGGASKSPCCQVTDD